MSENINGEFGNGNGWSLFFGFLCGLILIFKHIFGNVDNEKRVYLIQDSAWVACRVING